MTNAWVHTAATRYRCNDVRVTCATTLVHPLTQPIIASPTHPPLWYCPLTCVVGVGVDAWGVVRGYSAPVAHLRILALITLTVLVGDASGRIVLLTTRLTAVAEVFRMENQVGAITRWSQFIFHNNKNKQISTIRACAFMEQKSKIAN